MDAGALSQFRSLSTEVGTLLDDKWAAFFAENKFLVGLSIDGPLKFHDTYRVDKKGGARYEKVIHGLKRLKKHGGFNTLTVVNKVNSQKPLEVYRFLNYFVIRVGNTTRDLIWLARRNG